MGLLLNQSYIQYYSQSTNKYITMKLRLLLLYFITILSIFTPTYADNIAIGGYCSEEGIYERNEIVISGEFTPSGVLLSGEVKGFASGEEYKYLSNQSGRIYEMTFYYSPNFKNVAEIKTAVKSILNSWNGNIEEKRVTNNSMYYVKMRGNETFTVSCNWQVNGYGEVIYSSLIVRVADYSLIL